MIVTITGVNDSLRKSELNKLVDTFIVSYDAMAVERFDGEDASFERMCESVQSLPFLSPKKLVILREPGKQRAFADTIHTILTSIADTTDLIIHEPKLDKRSSYYKTLKKQTDFRELNDLDSIALGKWAIEYTKGKGGSLNGADAKTLVDRLGPNQQQLQNELDKLLAYNPAITRMTIELLTEPLPQGTIFALLDAAFSGKTRRAFDLYAEQRALKVEPQAIIAMLAWQLYSMVLVKTAGKRGTDQVAKDAKLNPFIVRKNHNIVRNLTLEQLREFISDLLKLDMQLKRTSIDADAALQLYILNLSTKI